MATEYGQQRGIPLRHPAPSIRPFGAQTHQPAAHARDAHARRKNHHAHRLRRDLCGRGRCGRYRCILVGDSLGMVCQGLPQHRGRHPARHGLPHRKRGPRPAPCAGHGLADWRPAVWQLPRIERAGHSQRQCADAGRVPTWSSSRAAAGPPRWCTFWWSAAFRCAPTWA